MYEGQFYKDFNESDHTITPYTVYKQWSFTPSNYNTNGIQLSYGTRMTGSTFSTQSATNEDGTYKELVYAAVKNRYYQDTGSYYLETSPSIQRKINDNLIFIGIPQQKYGEQIKVGSFKMSYGGLSIIDDEKGNLIGTSASIDSYIGNIFYTDGNAIITQTGSYYTLFDSSSFTNISYKGQQTIYEHEFIVNIGQGELNSTINRSLYSANTQNFWTASNGSPLIYTSQSSQWSGSSIFNTDGFDPYITTIGLYNENDECLIVARLAKAIKNDKALNMSFRIRIDA